MGRVRFPELDAMRGIAALWVAAAHFSEVGIGWFDVLHPAIRLTPLRLVPQAHIPVVFFFVLSGFVLYRALRRGSETYTAFALRRFIRIYGPYAASIAFAALGMLMFAKGPVPEASSSMNDYWVRLDASTVLGHLAMTGVRPHVQLNVVTWSLIHEMRISLVIPLLAIVFARSVALGLAAAFCISVVGYSILSAAGQSQFWVPDTIALGIPMSMFYIAPFAVGMALGEVIDRHSPGVVLSVAVASLAGATALFRILALDHTGLSDYLVAIGAGAPMAIALTFAPLKRLLNTRPLTYLGKISYSLYLFHLPVLLLVAHALSGRVPLYVSVLIAIPVTAIVVVLAHRYVEAPSIELGKSMAKRVGPQTYRGTA